MVNFVFTPQTNHIESLESGLRFTFSVGPGLLVYSSTQQSSIDSIDTNIGCESTL